MKTYNVRTPVSRLDSILLTHDQFKGSNNGNRLYMSGVVRLNSNFTLTDFFEMNSGKDIIFHMNDDSIFYRDELGIYIRVSII